MTYNNKWARKPKQASKDSLFVTRKYYAYLDGEFKGEVTLTASRKLDYENKGYTFKATR